MEQAVKSTLKRSEINIQNQLLLAGTMEILFPIGIVNPAMYEGITGRGNSVNIQFGKKIGWKYIPATGFNSRVKFCQG